MAENRGDNQTNVVGVVGLVLAVALLIKWILKLFEPRAFAYTPISLRAQPVTRASGPTILVADDEFRVNESFQVVVTLDEAVPDGKTYNVEITTKVVDDVPPRANLNKVDLKNPSNERDLVQFSVAPPSMLTFRAREIRQSFNVTVSHIASRVNLVFAASYRPAQGKRRGGIGTAVIKE